jgi:hypothetical protein
MLHRYPNLGVGNHPGVGVWYGIFHSQVVAYAREQGAEDTGCDALNLRVYLIVREPFGVGV